MTEPSSLYQGLIQRLGGCGEIRRRWQVEFYVESVDRKNVVVDKWTQIGWRARTVVFGAYEEVIDDLSPVLASGNPAFSGNPVVLGEILYIPQCVKAAVTSYATTAKLRVPGLARVHDSSGD